MIQEKVTQIIRALLEKSLKDQVNWRHLADFGIDTDINDDFAVSLPDLTINIYRRKEDEEPIWFAIYDDTGNHLYETSFARDTQGYEEAERLFELAIIKARMISSVLDYLEAALATDEDIGSEPRVSSEEDI